MAWMIVIVLMIFYLLGLFVFHATQAIHLLPILALSVLIIDFLLARKWGRH